MSVDVSSADGITTVTINRPHARNAVNPETAQQLFDSFVNFEADSTQSVAILTGADGAFCAGYDLKAAAHGDGGGWLEKVDIPEGWADPMADPIPGPMGPSRLMLTKPVIAAIEGPAVAGGMELAAWCDLRVMSESAYIGVFCRRWGVPLIDGGTVRFPAILGQGCANDLVLTGRPMYAAEAQVAGFAQYTCAEGAALETAFAIARDLVRFPQGCMRADHLSARPSPETLAAGLKREWASAAQFLAEGRDGAARFAAGHGRGGDFADI